MNYNFNGKNIRIPDSDIERICKGMHIDKEEAISIWLDDEGYTVNTEQNALCEKAKAEKITQKIHDARAVPTKKTQRERVKKENPTKEMIISKLAEFLPEFAENVEIVNAGKLITFTLGENTFKLDLVQQRKKKS